MRPVSCLKKITPRRMPRGLVVGPSGFEPEQREPKSLVLPLHHGPPWPVIADRSLFQSTNSTFNPYGVNLRPVDEAFGEPDGQFTFGSFW